MDYTQLTESDVRSALSTIGVEAIGDLFAGLAERYRVKGSLDIPAGLSEPELLADLRRLAGGNTSTDQVVSFLGGGIYDHFIPTLVDALAMQGEFVTAYTPYQAEASQGVLQAFYEFQTLVCQLTGMDVSNASLYELATAAAEAMFMAHAINGRRKIVVSDAAHPDVRTVLRTYTESCADLDMAVVASDRGRTPLQAIKSALDDQTAAILIQHPTFLGTLEDMPAIADTVHAAGALLIVAVDPISCGLLKRPGDYGADIVVAEGQSLGNPQNFGGPVLGLLACRKQFLRKIPGRLVGKTTDARGRQSFCLTLQTREQHIRREKATSNVCTNQGLLAMRSTVYMATLGRKGIAEVARQCFDKAHYAAEQISKVPGFELAFEAPFYKEFVVRCRDKDIAQVLQAALHEGILAGVWLGRWYPSLADCFMVAVTEKRTKTEIDRLTAVLRDA